MVEHYELRKLLAITKTKHKDLAKAIGVSQQSTSKKIKGETEFKQTEMVLITEYFKKMQLNIIFYKRTILRYDGFIVL